MVAEPETSPTGRESRLLGFLLGAVVITVAFVAAISPLFDPYAEEDANPVALLVVAAGGYAVALALVVGRPRRLGQGMLVGLTVMLPAAWAGLLAANLGIFGWW